MGLGIDWPILRDIIRCLAFPVKPRHTHIAKKFDFYPQNRGKRKNLPFTLKILKPPLSCCPLLLAGPNWTPPTWMWVLVMIRPWGHSWGGHHGGKKAQNGGSGRNPWKRLKKNEKKWKAKHFYHWSVKYSSCTYYLYQILNNGVEGLAMGVTKWPKTAIFTLFWCFFITHCQKLRLISWSVIPFHADLLK